MRDSNTAIKKVQTFTDAPEGRGWGGGGGGVTVFNLKIKVKFTSFVFQETCKYLNISTK